MVVSAISVQLASVAAGAVALSLTFDCHLVVPTDPVANVSTLLDPLQTAPAPVIVFTTESGFTVKVTSLEVTLPHNPLVKVTLYLVPVNKVVAFLIFKVAVL